MVYSGEIIDGGAGKRIGLAVRETLTYYSRKHGK